MSSFETPSFRALSKWYRKQGSQFDAIAAAIATSSWTASL